MKIVIAPDKFKNSITGMQFCTIVRDTIQTILPNAELIVLPMADGGDGTIAVAEYYLKGKMIDLKVNNPLFETITASYLFSESKKTAFIEMAEASGLKLLQIEQYDCTKTTTVGTGELIVDAINRGATKVILGIGGSATNDCGTGMATALGYRFLDDHRQIVKPIGANLSAIKSIDATLVNPKLRNVTFEIACDVTNPLYGKNGAARVYASQKGANSTEIEMLDKGLREFSTVIEQTYDVNPQSIHGAGAAGGMGIASVVFLKGKLISGIQLMKELAQFDKKIESAQWIITGEGKLDNQTLLGKTIKGITDAAKDKNIKVAALCGDIDLSAENIQQLGIAYNDSIMSRASNLNDAIENTEAYLKEIVIDFVRKTLL